MALTNAQVEFAQSMVSFERVFEVLDIPVEIKEKPDAKALTKVKGQVVFDQVCFAYEGLGDDEKVGLDEIARFTWRGSGEAHLKRGKERDDESEEETGDSGPDASSSRAGHCRTSTLRSNRGSWWPWSDQAAPASRQQPT